MATKMTQEIFLEKLIKKYGELYQYNKVNYTGSRNKIILICPKHGEFSIRPDYLLGNNKCACQKCSFERRALKKILTNDEFIEKASKIHNNKYNYSKVNYINAHTKVCIICPEHGEFWQKPNSHLNGRGCYECFKERQGEFVKIRDTKPVNFFFRKIYVYS